MKESLRLPLAGYPGINQFVLDWLAGDPRATRLLRRAETPSSPPERRALDPRLTAALDASNRAWGIDARTELERWTVGRALTIVAGQQVGFAGGPLYTLSKLATIVRMKRDLEKEGIPVTAFFWLATEDHDFDEVSTLNVPASMLAPGAPRDPQRDLVCTRAARAADPRSAVGLLPVPDVLTSALLEQLGMKRPEWLQEGINLRDSFAKLVATLFGNEIVLVDALLPELRHAGAPLLEQIRERRVDVQAALKRRAGELEAAGYREQVVPRDGDDYTLLFQLDDENRRMPLPADAAPAPDRISTSAITRPLLQDFALQPDIFVGGPAEVAYYAQLSVLHELLGVAQPRVALRGHLLVAPLRVLRTIDRYQLDPASLFTSVDEIVASKEPEGIAAIHAITEAAKLDLMHQIERIGALALPADRSLSRSIQRSVGHLEYHFDKLSERASRAVARKERERWSATKEAVSTLFPDRKVSERVVNWFPYWRLYGERLVQRMIEEVEPDSDGFRIVGL